MRLWRALRAFVAALRRPASAVEHEAVTLVEIEGPLAYARAREQARLCREQGSVVGYRFWSRVAVEVANRTGRVIGETVAERMARR